MNGKVAEKVQKNIYCDFLQKMKG